MSRESLMTQMRKSRSLSLEQVAQAVQTDQANLSRVEKGRQVPKRELARRLYDFYGGTVPLAAIYDPEFYQAKAGVTFPTDSAPAQ
jgi:putative transcriptional regulator